MESNKLGINFRWVWVVILAAAVVLAIVMLLPKKNNTGANANKHLDALAKCLSDKGAKMYGAYWCSHCQAQKAEFGDSFKYINYVECTEKPDECASAGITGYPTWKTASTTLIGEQSLGNLASTTGCVFD